MSTTIRPELSEKNKYWIEKHRYYELKHFCLQYTSWKKAYTALDGMNGNSIVTHSRTNAVNRPTERCAVARVFYADRIRLLERVAKETDASLAEYLLKGVTEGISYDYLKARFDIPCCKDTYYELYRRFFWLLDKERQ